MPISNDLKKIYVTAPNDEYYVETLTLEHPKFSDGGVRYITNHKDGIVCALETGLWRFFQYVPFGTIPPNGSEQAALTLQVGIDNTSRELMDELEALSTEPTTPITITYRVYIDTDTSIVQNDPPLRLDILSVTATNNMISFEAGMINLRGLPFPSVLFTEDLYPGLSR